MENFILTTLFIIVIGVIVLRKQNNDDLHDQRIYQLEVEKVRAIQGIAAIMVLQGNTLDGDHVIGQSFRIDINTGTIERKLLTPLNALDKAERKQLTRQMSKGLLPANVITENGRVLVEQWEEASVNDLTQPLFDRAQQALNGYQQP